MEVPRVRRRWVVLAIVGLLALFTIRMLDQPLALESYAVVDQLTLVVTGFGAKTAWTHVTGVTETGTTVTVTVDSLQYLGFLPHSAAADRLDVEVHLTAPLGDRAVVDGSSGLPVAESE